MEPTLAKQPRKYTRRSDDERIADLEQKIAELKKMCNEAGVNPWIEVDGGCTPANTWKVLEAGANAIVAGSAVFKAPDYAEAIKGVRESKRPVVVNA